MRNKAQTPPHTHNPSSPKCREYMTALSDPCLLDLAYHNENPQEFVKELYRKLVQECSIELPQRDPTVQLVPDNWRSWQYKLHIVETAVDATPAYAAIVVLQYALNREEMLQTAIGMQLDQRRDFFQTQWLPFLEVCTSLFQREFSGTNATEVMRDYANIMLDAWQHQRIPVRARRPPPEDNNENLMEVD